MTAHRGPILPPGADPHGLPVGPFRARLVRHAGALWLVLEAGPYADAETWRHLATVPVGPGTADELRALARVMERALEGCA